MATTSLKVRHLGLTPFPNDKTWGSPLDEEGLKQWDALSKMPPSST
jgi:hypothetical protein